MSASWLINLGLHDGAAGVYTFCFIVWFVFDLGVLLYGVSPSPKFVPSTMKLSCSSTSLTSFDVGLLYRTLHYVPW